MKKKRCASHQQVLLRGVEVDECLLWINKDGLFVNYGYNAITRREGSFETTVYIYKRELSGKMRRERNLDHEQGKRMAPIQLVRSRDTLASEFTSASFYPSSPKDVLGEQNRSPHLLPRSRMRSRFTTNEANNVVLVEDQQRC